MTAAAAADHQMTAHDRAVSIILHGESKCGKSTLASTSPAPRLHLDAEGGMGTRFLRVKKTFWEPMKTKPPEDDGSWETCVVHVRDYETVKRCYDWLNSGKHPFKSVVLDSVSEIQQRAVDSIAGKESMQIQQWGDLLRQISSDIRGFRDLCNHPTKPLECVVAICMTHQDNDGVWRPYVQGQISKRLSYYFDICGYMRTTVTEQGDSVRQLLVSQHPKYEAGERVGGVLGKLLVDPNITDMMDTIFGTTD